MKKIVLICSSLALTAAVFVAPVKAAETKMSPAVIAIVDMQKVQEKSTAYQGMVKQRDKYVSELKAEVAKDEAALRKMEENINKERTTLTQEELVKKIDQFRNKMQEFQQKVQSRQEAIYKSFSTGTTKLTKDAFEPAVSEVAEKKGANMVTGSSQMMQFSPEFDITDEVIEIMNKKMPKFDLPKPKAEK